MGASPAELNSAITINGKNTTLDLSGVQKLMLAGKNYIATSKISAGSMNKVNSTDIMRGEESDCKGNPACISGTYRNSWK